MQANYLKAGLLKQQKVRKELFLHGGFLLVTVVVAGSFDLSFGMHISSSLKLLQGKAGDSAN